MNELIERINQLAKKARTEGLTEEETRERDALRQEYLKMFRSNFTSQLDSVVLVKPDGSRKALRKNH